jgi:hypothetical protein
VGDRLLKDWFEPLRKLEITGGKPGSDGGDGRPEPVDRVLAERGAGAVGGRPLGFEGQPDTPAVRNGDRVAAVRTRRLADDAGVCVDDASVEEGLDPGLASGLLVADDRKGEIDRRVDF